MRTKDLQKEEAIYTAALKLVLAKGFSALKMGDVAKAAGIATGSVYTYFENKEALINQLYLHLKKKSEAFSLKGYKDADPFMVCFEKLWKSRLSYAITSPEAAAFLEQYNRSPYLPEQPVPESHEPLCILLERGKKERLLKEVPVELMVLQITGAISALAQAHSRGTIKASPSIISKAFDMAWDSIRR